MKKIEITAVKLLVEKISCDHTVIEGDREVVGSSVANEAPTSRMLSALQDLTDALASVFYYGMKDSEWRKANIIATGFKTKWIGEDNEGAVITGKLRLESGRWVAINTDTIPFEDNAYGLNFKGDVLRLKKLVLDYFFIEPDSEQLEIETADQVFIENNDQL